MKYIRKILGALILFLNAITPPRRMKRSDEDQKAADQKAQNFTLYEFHACPFCVRVRRALRRLNIEIALRDAKDEKIGEQLLAGGGKIKVPCLRIQDGENVHWMYESKDIISHLESIFASN